MVDWLKVDDSKLICYCIKIDKQTIVSSIQSGNDTLSKIKKATKACTGDSCKELNPSRKCCSKDIKSLITFYSGKKDQESCSCCSN